MVVQLVAQVELDWHPTWSAGRILKALSTRSLEFMLFLYLVFSRF